MGTTEEDQILAFLQSCSTELTARAGDAPAESASAVAEGAAALALALEQSRPLEFQPGWLPALDTIELVDDTDLAHSFAQVASLLPWTPTRRATDEGNDFALSPLDSVRDLGELTVGIMCVRPNAQYPLHHHPPQEAYLTLSGQARWRFGGNDDFRPVGPNSVLYNHPNDWHSAKAGEAPLVALYVLWP